MTAQLQVWMPAVVALFGTLIVVVFTAWINTRALSSQIDSVRSHIDSVRNELRSEMQTLRAEMKQSMAELELRLSKQIMDLAQRVERLEEARGLVRP